MKKLIFLLVFLLAVSWIHAEKIDETDLINVAKDYIEFENSRLSGDSPLMTFKAAKALIFNGKRIGTVVEMAPEGFFIMPGISELAPVKLVSYKGNFEGIKSHPFIQQLLNRIYYTWGRLSYIKTEDTHLADRDDPIDTLRKQKNESLWTGALTGRFSRTATTADVPTAVAPLLTSTWNQGTPTASGNAYNMYTPTVDGKHCYTGCSATAQAQVMYYWKYPTFGQGSHSYTWNAQTLSADFAHQYYWNDMVDNYNGGQTTAQNQAVGRLMADVGISINMNYGLSGSGAVINRNNSLYTFFKYSPDVTTRYRSHYASWAAWYQMFKAQMDSGWPSILATFKPGSGHAIVVDGYRSSPSDQLHINMGWGGYHDGYYSIDDVYGYGDASSDYAVVNIYPPGGGQTLTVAAPNGGENWPLTTTKNITWNSTGISGNVKITLWRNGSQVGIIAGSVAASSGSFPWTVGSYVGGTAAIGGNYTVKIKDKSSTLADSSNASFSIAAAPSITVSSPNGGESYGLANNKMIKWSCVSVPGNVKITLWRNGSLVGTIASSVSASAGQYLWVVGSHSGGTAPTGSGYSIKVKEKGSAVEDMCNSSFSIVTPQIVVLSPNGGENLNIGGSANITWNAIALKGYVKISLWRNGSQVGVIAPSIKANLGTFSWTIGNHLGGTAGAGSGYIIKIKRKGYPEGDTSNAAFTLSN